MTAAFPDHTLMAFLHAFPLLTIGLFADDCSVYHAITGRMENQILRDDYKKN